MPYLRATLLSLTAAFMVSVPARARDGKPEREPIIGGPCEGCEAVFEGLPDSLSSRSRIAPEDEPGEPMRIEGTVYDRSGRPVPGIIVYAYHTNDEGIYPRDESMTGWAARHGRLRGWVRTNGEGRYRFDTIRPGGYPGRDDPEHVHMHVIEPGRCTYWIDSVTFEDDPRMTGEIRERRADGRGGSGLVEPKREQDGTWMVTRDIHLGKGVPGYPERALRALEDNRQKDSSTGE
jgi:protocatechuate 3,4-dioxygenase beta subunit